MPLDPENAGLIAVSKAANSWRAKLLRKSAARSASTAFFARAANDFAFRCSRWKKWWTGRS